MTVGTVTSTQVTCNRLTAGQPCPARLLVDGLVPGYEIRRFAADRGWTTGPEGDLCPSHR